MNQSEKIDLLVQALNKAQAAMSAVKKDSENPFFKSHYAKLENYIEAFQKYYTPQGLSFTQVGDVVEGKTCLSTVLCHSSGQFIRSYYPISPDKAGPQSVGANWTYARRYDLAAITGLPDTDDDGEAAMNRNPPNNTVPSNAKPRSMASTGHISEAQAGRLWAIANKAHWTKDHIKEYVKTLGLNTEMALNQGQYSHLCGLMEKYPKEKLNG